MKDEITFKLMKMLLNSEEDNAEKTSSILDDAIGRYVIVRTRNEGINSGYVVEADSTGIVLKDARRLYDHKPLDRKLSWYEGVAESGLRSDSRISGKVDRKIIIEDYSITYCTKKSENNLIEFCSNEQS